MATPSVANSESSGLGFRQRTLTGFARDVHEGLSKPQKELPARYLYDAVGSALFEAITAIPEYGVTRAEERVLRGCAAEVASMSQAAAVVELGSGSGRKTRPLLEAVAARRIGLSYCAIDVSGSALENCRQQCDGVRRVTVELLQRSYLEGLTEYCSRPRSDEPLLVLFLGSSIGNFGQAETLAFLRTLRETIRSGDFLLLGTDLMQSPVELLEAYDDPVGVTAAFNLNLLARINRELEADFQPRLFRHESRWCAAKSRVEMHLVSTVAQSVLIRGAECRVWFEEGESIWTESSYKFHRADLPVLAERTGFASVAQWIDGEWPFAENLWIADGR